MTLYESITHIINAGIDMMMLAETNPGVTPTLYQSIVKEAVEKGDIAESRINEAVRRILGVKFAMNLVTDEPKIKDAQSDEMIAESY